jgi:succinyl-CoA synthetase beta subunit
MNLYEFEGKQFFEKQGIAIPKGVNITRDMDAFVAYNSLGVVDVVVKAQVLSGKRGKNNGIRFCASSEEVVQAVTDLFSIEILDQYVASVRIEKKLHIAEEQYMSITYDTNKKQPVLVYSKEGGVDIEDVLEKKIVTHHLNILEADVVFDTYFPQDSELAKIAQKLWHCFLEEDCRLVEINPLVKTADGEWIAADAKIAIDEDAFYRHKEREFTPRTMMGRPPTEREIAVQEIDKGEKYYQGTAGKYIEMDGDIAILFSGGGASIANMDALLNCGIKAANYTEYSGNPPREKVHALAKIVLSKPNLRGLWIAGGVANFTNVKETFQGIVDALDEVKPTYPIVVRRAGPFEEEGMALMKECADRNSLNMHLFGKETSMSDSAKILADLVHAT